METDPPESKHQEWILWGLVCFVWLLCFVLFLFTVAGEGREKDAVLYELPPFERVIFSLVRF